MTLNNTVFGYVMQRNYDRIGQYASGITHAGSVATPHYAVNNFNWVLGHMVCYRDYLLEMLAQAQCLSEAEKALYQYGSEAITPSGPSIDFVRLLALLDESHARLLAALDTADLSTHPQQDRFLLYMWHETYHVGNTEYARQIALAAQS